MFTLFQRHTDRRIVVLSALQTTHIIYRPCSADTIKTISEMIHMKEYLANFENCLEKEIPYCVGECPFEMEILNFIEKAQCGSFQAAFKVYRNATGFPRIANQLCHAPCKGACPRKDAGGSIEMSLLEKAALAHARDTSPTDYNIPAKKERIAILGAGLAGMAALLRLSTKKYTVEVFEKSDKAGGHLWGVMSPEIFQKDFQEQLAHQDYRIHFNREITDLNELQGFHAVLIATGKGGNDFGLLESVGIEGDPYCMEKDGVGYFAVGQLIGDEPVYALAGGLAMGTVIDNYLKTRKLYYPRTHSRSRMCAGMVEIPDSDSAAAIRPADGGSYTKDEAMAEASRCVKCQCSACRDHCDLLEFTGKWPVKVKDEILATTLEGKSELKATPARRLMSLCNQCGICKEVCPEDIDLDGLFLAGRQKMHSQGKMPWPYHDFWLRDMSQANGEEAALIRAPKGMESASASEPSKSTACTYALFPGCQLGASEPEIIVKLYDSLLNQHPDTAMFLRCCGVPALWAGDTSSFQDELTEIREGWQKLGQPTMIMGCMTCMKHFKEYLPEIPVISLPEILSTWDISGGCCEKTYCVFDPCAARDEETVRRTVRQLAEDMGVTVEPLPDNNTYFNCCGYGGHGEIASPEYAGFVAKKRISESDTPYITYCINCRDSFIKQGKEARHILELIFGEEEARTALPTVTERQDNRRQLKYALLEFFWEETMKDMPEKYPVTLEMSDEIKQKLDKEKILEEQIAHTVDFCQRHNRTILDEETGILSGYCTIGHATYWVEYEIVDEDAGIYRVHNAYSHRTRIELEAVWNGIKQETDLQ
ncbi:MAG: 4Fe-4S dicluster domain-containing protein [Bacillota bacterium]|nr:4Fe-4S dicluster domain-containing protein [Bacillota bacterium]